MSVKSYSTNYVSPYSRTEVNFSRKAVGFRQGTGPYVKRLGYQLRKQTCTLIPNGTGMGNAAAGNYFAVGLAPGHNDARNRAYAKFRDKLGTTANLAVAIAERKEAATMLGKRASQLLTFAYALSTRRYSTALNALGISVLSKKDYRRTVKYKVVHDRTKRDYEVTFKKSARSFGDNFLEVVFGWVPVVSDIGNAVEVLYKQPLKQGEQTKIIGKATSKGAIPINPVTGQFDTGWTGIGSVQYQLIADVTVTNTNSLKLKQLGFTNPAALIWEATPFSFLLDWFVNVGDVLSAYDDFIGMTMSNQFTSIMEVIDMTESYGWVNTRRYNHVHFDRVAGISGPTLTIRPPKLPSIQRGLTAVALLTQFLGKAR